MELATCSARCKTTPWPTITFRTSLQFIQLQTCKILSLMRINPRFKWRLRGCQLLEICTTLVCTRKTVKQWHTVGPESPTVALPCSVSLQKDVSEVLESNEDGKGAAANIWSCSRTKCMDIWVTIDQTEDVQLSLHQFEIAYSAELDTSFRQRQSQPWYHLRQCCTGCC